MNQSARVAEFPTVAANILVLAVLALVLLIAKRRMVVDNSFRSAGHQLYADRKC